MCPLNSSLSRIIIMKTKKTNRKTMRNQKVIHLSVCMYICIKKKVYIVSKKYNFEVLFNDGKKQFVITTTTTTRTSRRHHQSEI